MFTNMQYNSECIIILLLTLVLVTIMGLLNYGISNHKSVYVLLIITQTGLVKINGVCNNIPSAHRYGLSLPLMTVKECTLVEQIHLFVNGRYTLARTLLI